ncbi:dihydrolipoamide acetyltransferase family protein [Neobacillus sp. PS3-34]|uniref:dihydrolipoamide acetyltransferase family protein n=1 Tax=Neobacillus sp. PS3-34 TaxID=3070678 RepID=UPI0035A58AF0
MEVKLHDIGEGMTEAEINCFLVKPGDIVNADEPLVEVQTDKMVAEIPSPAAGKIIEFKVESGQTVSVGSTLLIMEALSNPKNEQSDTLPKTIKNISKTLQIENRRSKSMTSGTSTRILASPYTRKIARDNSVNIEWVNGTGPSGRITDEDVYRFIQMQGEEMPKEKLFASRSREEEVTIAKEKCPSAGKTIPFRGRRKQIAKKMHQSVYTIPHCTHFEELDVTELIRFREELKSEKENISATAFFIKALSVCLKKFPIFNAQLDEENEVIRLLPDHHIGLAIDTDDGLIVPVLKNIQAKTLREIHKEMKVLTQKALENKLELADISGGTFTISNVGGLGEALGLLRLSSILKWLWFLSIKQRKCQSLRTMTKS